LQTWYTDFCTTMQYAHQISKRLTTLLLRFMSRILSNNTVNFMYFQNIITANCTNSLKLLFVTSYNSLRQLFLAKLYQNLIRPQQISQIASPRLCLLWMPFSVESSQVMARKLIYLTPLWSHFIKYFLVIFTWPYFYNKMWYQIETTTNLSEKFNYLSMVPSIRP